MALVKLRKLIKPAFEATPSSCSLVIEGVKPKKVKETRLGYKNKTISGDQYTAGKKSLTRRQQRTKKKPETSFKLIETTDASLGLIMAAKAINVGLKSNETVVLVSPENIDHMIRKLEMTGLDVRSFLRTHQLTITQFKVDNELNSSTNYRAAFGKLCKRANTVVDRIVILQMDKIVNLDSQDMAYKTVSKFTQAADEMGCKVMAQFSWSQSEAYDRLDAACSSLVNAYFVMKRGDSGQGRKYYLHGKNYPV